MISFKDNSVLAKRLRSGDHLAFDYLVDTYYRRLFIYAQKLINDHGKAEDIVQNVLAELWISRKKINPELSINGLLHKSVYNEFIDQYRKNKPVLYLEKKYLEALDFSVEGEQQNLDEVLAQLELEIDKLPEKCKHIFLLNKKEGLTHREISNYLGISVKTIEGHMARAFKLLSKNLGEKFDVILFVLFGQNNFGLSSD